MTEQEKFEQWWNKTKGTKIKHIGFSSFTAEVMFSAWQAAKQDSATEIAQLKADEFNATADLLCIHAENLKLREALEKLANLGSGISPYYGNSQGNMIARQALASTPAQSLQAHDDEVIELCAKICDWDAKQSRQIAEPFAANVAEILAEEIRELKGK